MDDGSITLSGDMAKMGFSLSTSTLATFSIGPKKEAGFCDKHGIDHAWEAGPILTSNPPIITRRCINCGKSQRLEPEYWRDYD